MDEKQFNEMLSYVMLIALNSTQLLFQQSRQRPLTDADVAECQDYLLLHATQLQDALGRKSLKGWPPVPAFGRADE